MPRAPEIRIRRTGTRRTRTEGAIAYLRVSTDEQAVSGLGLAAQESAIRAECARRGLAVLAVYTDAGLSAKKLDRLTRSVHDATGLMAAAERAGWGLVALDVAVDTTTPQGAAMAQVLAVFAELERRLIGERTRAALAVKRSQGITLGRPTTMTDETVTRILAAHEAGQGWSAIARELNEAGEPTAQGGKRWYASTVRAVVARHAA